MQPEETLKAVEAIYAAALEPDKWPDALDRIAQVTGGVGGVIVPVAPVGQSKTIFSPSLEESVRDYEQEWWRRDRRAAEGRARKLTHGIWTDADVLSEEDRARDPFYQEFLRPWRFGDFIAQLTVPIPGHVLSVSVQRDLRRGAFEREERERFAFLGGHAVTALSATVRLLEANRVTQALGASFDHLGCGVLALDRQGVVTYASDTALALLNSRDGLSLRQGRLSAVRPQDQRALDRLVGSVLAEELTAPSLTVTIPDSSARTPSVLVQAIPLGTSLCDRFEQVALDRGVLLLLHDLSPGGGDRLVACLKQMGLTAAQARVAEAVGRGLTPKEAAIELGLSDATVRTVLKSVFEKLGLSRQSQLAVLVTRLSQLGG